MRTAAMMRQAAIALAIAGGVVCGGTAEAGAQERPRGASSHTDVWSEPNPGLKYLHRTTTVPCSIHALLVDLRHEGVRLRATPYDERWQRTSAYAQNAGLAAAINGGFWGMMQSANGMTAGGGRRWPDGEDDDEVGFFAVTRSGRAWVSPPEVRDDEVDASRVAEAVSGRPQLVREGVLDQAALDEFPYSNVRHPRSAVGATRDGKTVILVVVDGRQGFSRGMTLYELARFMLELGAHNALNLDGGGSSAMYVANAGGVVNAPSGGRWEARLGLGATEGRRPSKSRRSDAGVEEVFIRGYEREVMNHIGVVAPPPATGVAVGPRPSVLDEDPAISADGTQVTVQPPRHAAMQLGRWRELIYPLAYGALVFVPLLVLAFWWRRRRRKKMVKAASSGEIDDAGGAPTAAQPPPR
jgi:uncharacterized protein YigE (DUF2233 family)